MSYSEYEVDQWIQAVANLHHNTAHDRSDERRACEALANVWSAYGFQDAPIEVLRMLVTATEIGYLAALNDLRNGDLDDQIATERPDLIGQ